MTADPPPATLRGVGSPLDRTVAQPQRRFDPFARLAPSFALGQVALVVFVGAPVPVNSQAWVGSLWNFQTRLGPAITLR